jgi:4-hydroxybenzoate polyprenyltransferase
MIATGVAAGAAAPIAGIALVSAAAVVWVAERFRRAPSPKRQTAFEQAAGVWVLVSYLALGFVPFALRGIA